MTTVRSRNPATAVSVATDAARTVRAFTTRARSGLLTAEKLDRARCDAMNAITLAGWALHSLPRHRRDQFRTWFSALHHHARTDMAGRFPMPTLPGLGEVPRG